MAKKPTLPEELEGTLAALQSPVMTAHGAPGHQVLTGDNVDEWERIMRAQCGHRFISRPSCQICRDVTGVVHAVQVLGMVQVYPSR